MSESLVRRAPGRPKGISTPVVQMSQLRRMTRSIVDAVFAELMQGTLQDLEKVLLNPDIPMLHLIVATVIKKGFDTGDPKILDFILDRTIGKVREQIDVDMIVEERLKKHDELLRVVPRGQLIEMIRVDQKVQRDE